MRATQSLERTQLSKSGVTRVISRHRTVAIASILAFTLLITSTTNAQNEPSPELMEGTWHTVSDVDGKPRGIVEVFRDTNNTYSGKIAGSLRGETADAVCAKCTGDRKDKPLLGMVIFSGMKWNGSVYTGGEILDPDSGKTYRCQIRVEDGGKRLNVRGYIGIPTIGRSQIWMRPKP